MAKFGDYHQIAWSLIYESAAVVRWAEEHHARPFDVLNSVRHRYPPESVLAYDVMARDHPAMVALPKESEGEDHERSHDTDSRDQPPGTRNDG